MNTYFALCLLAFVAVASANPIGHVVPVATIETISHPHYSFSYAVNDPHTGDNKNQWEARDGDSVRGAYSLVEPDGNVRHVEYTADSHTGFNALVSRSGPNLHSVALPVAAPVVAPVIEHAPVVETAVIDHAPIIEHAPLFAPIWNAPILSSSPLVQLSGSSHGPHGLVNNWAAGPISLDGRSLTIHSSHH